MNALNDALVQVNSVIMDQTNAKQHAALEKIEQNSIPPQGYDRKFRLPLWDDERSISHTGNFRSITTRNYLGYPGSLQCIYE